MQKMSTLEEEKSQCRKLVLSTTSIQNTEVDEGKAKFIKSTCVMPE